MAHPAVRLTRCSKRAPDRQTGRHDRLMDLTHIRDGDDERLDPYRAIRERDLTGRHNLFIAEGKSVLAVLARQKRHAIQSVLILENRLNSVSHILADLPGQVPVYTVNRAVIDQIAGFPMHRGILAIARRPDLSVLPGKDETRRWRTIIALSGIANHDNMGAIFRNAAAFGADAVVMDAGSCDPFYRKAIRVSVGGVLTIPALRFTDAETMAGWLADAGFETVALSPSARHPVSQWTPAQRTAILLGAEGPGLPADMLNRHTTLSIPMAPGFDSLNVAVTSAIVLHHLMTCRKTG
jgi:tRNA G18 (ribose-2'-O)-methylase SpoU